ncbi:hypothetical protein Hanom_Chr12g01086661 [Helianthus anomalus]
MLSGFDGIESWPLDYIINFWWLVAESWKLVAGGWKLVAVAGSW